MADVFWAGQGVKVVCTFTDDATGEQLPDGMDAVTVAVLQPDGTELDPAPSAGLVEGEQSSYEAVWTVETAGLWQVRVVGEVAGHGPAVCVVPFTVRNTGF